MGRDMGFGGHFYGKDASQVVGSWGRCHQETGLLRGWRRSLLACGSGRYTRLDLPLHDGGKYTRWWPSFLPHGEPCQGAR
jgi:hypothetical protein